MAIAVVIEMDGTTLDQYDEVCALMGLTPRSEGEEGGLFHWVTATDTGIRITDVWESKEPFEKFSAEKLGPTLQQVGVAATPRITFYDVHNYFTAGTAARV